LAGPSSRNPEELFNSAVQFRGRGQIDEALSNLEEAIRLQPGYAEAHSQRAMLLWQKKLLEEALFSFSEALKYALDCQLRASLWYNKGLILQKCKDMIKLSPILMSPLDCMDPFMVHTITKE